MVTSDLLTPPSQNSAFYVQVDVQPWTTLHLCSYLCSCLFCAMFSASSSGELSLKSIISSIPSVGVENEPCGPRWILSSFWTLSTLQFGAIIHHLLTGDADLDERGGTHNKTAYTVHSASPTSERQVGTDQWRSWGKIVEGLSEESYVANFRKYSGERHFPEVEREKDGERQREVPTELAHPLYHKLLLQH